MRTKSRILAFACALALSLFVGVAYADGSTGSSFDSDAQEAGATPGGGTPVDADTSDPEEQQDPSQADGAVLDPTTDGSAETSPPEPGTPGSEPPPPAEPPSDASPTDPPSSEPAPEPDPSAPPPPEAPAPPPPAAPTSPEAPPTGPPPSEVPAPEQPVETPPAEPIPPAVPTTPSEPLPPAVPTTPSEPLPPEPPYTEPHEPLGAEDSPNAPTSIVVRPWPNAPSVLSPLASALAPVLPDSGIEPLFSEPSTAPSTDAAGDSRGSDPSDGDESRPPPEALTPLVGGQNAPPPTGTAGVGSGASGGGAAGVAAPLTAGLNLVPPVPSHVFSFVVAPLRPTALVFQLKRPG